MEGLPKALNLWCNRSIYGLYPYGSGAEPDRFIEVEHMSELTKEQKEMEWETSKKFFNSKFIDKSIEITRLELLGIDKLLKETLNTFIVADKFPMEMKNYITLLRKINDVYMSMGNQKVELIINKDCPEFEDDDEDDYY